MRKILLVLMACLILVSVAGCGGANGDVEKGNDTGIVETNKDYMEKYISNLSTNDERTAFLSFWNSITSYCSGLEYKLGELENTAEYSFDPTKADNIPAEIKEQYDFASIKFFKGFATHKDFEMTINGENVKLSFDGEEFYPSNYGYSEVEALVEKYNAE